MVMIRVQRHYKAACLSSVIEQKVAPSRVESSGVEGLNGPRKSKEPESRESARVVPVPDPVGGLEAKGPLEYSSRSTLPCLT